VISDPATSVRISAGHIWCGYGVREWSAAHHKSPRSAGPAFARSAKQCRPMPAAARAALRMTELDDLSRRGSHGCRASRGVFHPPDVLRTIRRPQCIS
jgi:hypothetical protein